jgi:hypothetical protein
MRTAISALVTLIAIGSVCVVGFLMLQNRTATAITGDTVPFETQISQFAPVIAGVLILVGAALAVSFVGLVWTALTIDLRQRSNDVRVEPKRVSGLLRPLFGNARRPSRPNPAVSASEQ